MIERMKTWIKRRKATNRAIRKNAETVNAERWYGPRSDPYLLRDNDVVSKRVFDAYEKLMQAYSKGHSAIALGWQIKLMRMGWYVPYRLHECRQIVRKIGGSRYSR